MVPHLPSQRRPACAALSLTALMLVGCGGLQPQPTRTPWQCVERSRTPAAVTASERTNPAALLGWISVGSVDATVEIVDRVGQRAGVFASGTSVRKQLLDGMTEAIATWQLKGVEWLDPSRPIHLIFQNVGGDNALDGVALLVPILEANALAESLPDGSRGDAAAGHFARIPGSTAESPPRAWVDLIRSNDYALLSPSPDRFAALGGETMCFGSCQPSGALHVGVALGALIERYRDDLVDALEGLNRLARLSREGFGANHEGADQSEAAEPVAGQVIEWLTQVDGAELAADADTTSVALTYWATARPDTSLAAQTEAQRGHSIDGLGRGLPGNAWLAAVSSVDPLGAQEYFDLSIRSVLEQMPGWGGPFFREVTARLREIVGMMNGTTQMACYDDRLASATGGGFGFLIGVGSKVPGDLAATLATLTYDAFKRGVLLTYNKVADRAGIEASAAGDKDASWLRMLEDQQTWTGLWTAYRGAMVAKGYSFDFGPRTAGQASCDALTFKPDWAALAASGSAKVGATARGLLGDEPTFAVCTTSRALVLVAGPNALERVATFAAAEQSGAPPAGLEVAPHYQRVLKAGLRAPASVFLFDATRLAALLSPVTPMAAAIVSQLPADDPISATCTYAGRTGSCRAQLPLSWIDVLPRLKRLL